MPSEHHNLSPSSCGCQAFNPASKSSKSKNRLRKYARVVQRHPTLVTCLIFGLIFPQDLRLHLHRIVLPDSEFRGSSKTAAYYSAHLAKVPSNWQLCNLICKSSLERTCWKLLQLKVEIRRNLREPPTSGTRCLPELLECVVKVLHI